MNRKSSGSLSLNKAITGFLNYKMAEGLANRSIDSYEQLDLAAFARPQQPGYGPSLGAYR